MPRSGRYEQAVLAKLAEVNPRMGVPSWGLEDLLELPLDDPGEWSPAIRHSAVEGLLALGLITEECLDGQWAIPSTYYTLAD